MTLYLVTVDSAKQQLEKRCNLQVGLSRGREAMYQVVTGVLLLAVLVMTTEELCVMHNFWAAGKSSKVRSTRLVCSAGLGISSLVSLWAGLSSLAVSHIADSVLCAVAFLPLHKLLFPRPLKHDTGLQASLSGVEQQQAVGPLVYISNASTAAKLGCTPSECSCFFSFQNTTHTVSTPS